MPQRSGFSLFLGRLYLAYAGLLWLLTFLVLYPLFVLCILIKPLQPLTLWLNKIWCIVFFPLSGQLIKVQGTLPKGPVVYVSNHASYMDIPLLTWVLPGFICFIGKASLAKLPLFGFYFRNLHVAVDRKNSVNRALSLKLSVDKVNQGRPLVVFPEGRIHDKQPQLHPFHDGAFRIAIQTGVPVVPITIAYNWLILPDDGSFSARWKVQQVVIHPPLPTTGLTEEDVPALKLLAFDAINKDLTRLNAAYINPSVPHENR